MEFAPHPQRRPFDVARQNSSDQIAPGHHAGGELAPGILIDLNIQGCRAVVPDDVGVRFVVRMKDDRTAQTLA